MMISDSSRTIVNNPLLRPYKGGTSSGAILINGINTVSNQSIMTVKGEAVVAKQGVFAKNNLGVIQDAIHDYESAESKDIRFSNSRLQQMIFDEVGVKEVDTTL